MMNPVELKKIAQFICDKTGIIYHEETYYQLEKRIIQFSSENSLSLANFLPSLVASPILASKFLELATNNESYFFRDPGAWSAFTDLLEEKIKREKTASMSGLFLGCSRGQEIYTFQMLIAERKNEINNMKFSLSAFDFNSSVLKQAERGIYSQLEVSRGVTPKRLTQFFSPIEESNESYLFNTQLRMPCDFKIFNLLTDKLPRESYDFIVCRNVLIYQNDIAKKKILSGIFEALKPGGILFLGAAEKILSANLGEFKEKNINSMNFYVK